MGVSQPKNEDNTGPARPGLFTMMHMDRRTLLSGLLAAPAAASPSSFPNIPKSYLEEADTVPDFWIGSVDEVGRFLDERIRRGKVRKIGTTAGGRSMRCVFYGEPRAGKGTTTFSGSLGFRDVRAYRGPEHSKKVYMAIGSVHGGEIEGIVGIVNLIAVLETGADLLGRPWPAIQEAARELDRMILLPITNLDGRARVPLRMIRHRGTDHTVHEYFNTGGKLDGTLLGWPDCKEFIPLDFKTVQFPGGYPNDAGVNIQHDDFLGAPQPETRALLALTAAERPDLILNMHTGTAFVQPLRPFLEPALTPAWEQLYRQVLTGLTRKGLRATGDTAREAEPIRRMSPYNLDTALNLNCGALALTVESPSHNYAKAKRQGELFVHTPAQIVTAHLTCHQESMTYLAQSGGRSRWAA